MALAAPALAEGQLHLKRLIVLTDARGGNANAVRGRFTFVAICLAIAAAHRSIVLGTDLRLRFALARRVGDLNACADWHHAIISASAALESGYPAAECAGLTRRRRNRCIDVIFIASACRQHKDDRR